MSKKKKGSGSAATRRGRKGWTTAAQEEYLSSHIPAFLAAQAKKKSSELWPIIHTGWFEKFPLLPPTQQEIDGNVDEDTRKARQRVVST